jgi:hypothetical protein
MGLSCDTDIGAVMPGMAGFLISSFCPLTCGLCACAEPVTVDCHSTVQDTLVETIVEVCYGQEQAIYRRGYGAILEVGAPTPLSAALREA